MGINFCIYARYFRNRNRTWYLNFEYTFSRDMYCDELEVRILVCNFPVRSWTLA